ncbi:MAG: hypothetical protein WC007_13020 [Pelobacteraceae bacterium]
MNLPENTSPLAEMSARIGWRVRLSEIVFADPPYLIIQSVPEFTGCYGKLDELDILWDVHALINSVKRPGAYQLLTCKCGVASHAGLNEAVLVSHPDAQTVIWELDIAGLRPALNDSFADMAGGFIRLIFRREEYEADIRVMASELQNCGRTIFSAANETDLYGLSNLLDYYGSPDISLIKVEEMEPGINGMELDELLKLDLNEPLSWEALWPSGSVVEFGFFPMNDGHELMKVDGSCRGNGWPGRYFTRWQALPAFNAWLSFVQRSWGLGDGLQAPSGAGRNEFLLLQETDRELCHEAGKRFAAVMQACCNEGATAPDVTVLYSETTLLCAVRH